MNKHKQSDFSQSRDHSRSNQVIKISVTSKQFVRTTSEQYFPSECLISETGYSESLRKARDGFFRIGRQQVTESGERPNDLMLPPTDRAISRTHCMINYQPFFNRSIPDDWLAFIMASHPRLGENSWVKFLPDEILRHIISFLRFPRLPLLIDLGSMCGTFIKVSNVEPILLTQGLSLLVGSDIIIELDKVENEFGDLDKDEFKGDGNNTINDFNYHLPFVIVKISKAFTDQDATMTVQTHKFQASYNNAKFTIGRSQSCHVNLNENTISRVQCRVVYEEKKWRLYDGSEGKPTVNGTWLSICKRNNGVREISDPVPFKSGTQIKISDTILEVTWN